MDTERRGPNRLRTAVAVLLTCAMAAVACGGGSSTSPAEEPAAAAAAVTVTLAAAAVSLDNQTDNDTVETLAEQLIEDLGSDAAAVEALILAMEAGHDPVAILEASATGGLTSAGAIDGVEPAQPKLGLVSAAAKSTKSQRFSLRHGLQDDKAPLPVSFLRDSIDVLPGTSGTLLILRLLAHGYSSEQIVEGIIFGSIDGPPADRDALRRAAIPPSRVAPTTESESAEDLFDDLLEGEEPEVEEGRFRYRGSLIDALGLAAEPGDRVVVDSVDLVATIGSVVTFEGRATLLGESAATDSNGPTCIWIEIDFDAFEASTIAFQGIEPIAEFSGVAELRGAWTDTLCPAEGTPPPDDVLPAPFTATLVPTEQLVIVVTVEDDDPVTIVALLTDE